MWYTYSGAQERDIDMGKVKRRAYYLKNREHILFYKREYNLKYGNRHRKYYRNFNIQAQMPVDLFMMRNEMRFREGFNLIESE